MIRFVLLILFLFPFHLFSQSDSSRIEMLFKNLSSQFIYWKYRDTYSFYLPNGQKAFLPIQIALRNKSTNLKKEYFICESNLKFLSENRLSIFFYYYSFSHDLNDVKNIVYPDNTKLRFSMTRSNKQNNETLKNDLLKIKHFELYLDDLYKLQKRTNELSEEVTGKIVMASLLTVVGIAGINSSETGFKKTFAQIGGLASFMVSAYLIYDFTTDLFEISKNKSEIEKLNMNLDNIVSK